MAEWIDVGASDLLGDGEMLGLVAAGTPVVLVRSDGDYAALHDLCTHGQARLSEGYLDGGCIECPLHQALFDIRTGAAMSAPATEPIRTFPVRLSGGRLEIQV